MAGLVIRQPSVVDHIIWWLRGWPLSGLGTIHGARLMDSTPPATHSEASPTATARLASMTASMPDPHSRLTVAPGTRTGKPARRAAMRETLRWYSPAPLESP